MFFNASGGLLAPNHDLLEGGLGSIHSRSDSRRSTSIDNTTRNISQEFGLLDYRLFV